MKEFEEQLDPQNLTVTQPKEIFEEQHQNDVKTDFVEEGQMTGQKTDVFESDVTEVKSENVIAVESNMQKVALINDLDVDYSSEKKRKDAIKKAYKETGKSGSPDKLGDRQKKMTEKMDQQKRLKEYVPEPVDDMPLVQRRMLADFTEEHISSEMTELKTKMEGLHLNSNEEVSKNYPQAMAFISQLEKFKDSVYNAFYNNALEKETQIQIREFLCCANKFSEHVKARTDLIQNKYYLLLSGKDTAKMTDEELVQKAAQYKGTNPELARYYEILSRTRSKNLSGKDVASVMEEAKALVSQNKDGWDDFLKEGKAERDEYIQEKERKRMKMKREVTKKKAEDELYASDDTYKEYPLIKSTDMVKEFMKHDYNKPGTKESSMLYARYFQFGKENSDVYTDTDNTYFMSGNSSIINAYVRDPEEGLKRRREYLRDVKYKSDKKFNAMPSQEQEDFIEAEVKQWEKEAQVRIKMLRDGCKADKIPHNAHLFRMVGDDVLDRLGVRGKTDQETVDNINKKAGSTYKETSFASVGYRVDNVGAIKRMPIMFTILCDKGKKCFISANLKETEILFDRPEYEIVKAEVCTSKKVPYSDTTMTLSKKGPQDLDFSNESVGTFKGINITVKLKTSAAEE